MRFSIIIGLVTSLLAALAFGLTLRDAVAVYGPLEVYGGIARSRDGKRAEAVPGRARRNRRGEHRQGGQHHHPAERARDAPGLCLALHG